MNRFWLTWLATLLVAGSAHGQGDLTIRFPTDPADPTLARCNELDSEFRQLENDNRQRIEQCDRQIQGTARYAFKGGPGEWTGGAQGCYSAWLLKPCVPLVQRCEQINERRKASVQSCREQAARKEESLRAQRTTNASRGTDLIPVLQRNSVVYAKDASTGAALLTAELQRGQDFRNLVRAEWVSRMIGNAQALRAALDKDASDADRLQAVNSLGSEASAVASRGNLVSSLMTGVAAAMVTDMYLRNMGQLQANMADFSVSKFDFQSAYGSSRVLEFQRSSWALAGLQRIVASGGYEGLAESQSIRRFDAPAPAQPAPRQEATTSSDRPTYSAASRSVSNQPDACEGIQQAIARCSSSSSDPCSAAQSMQACMGGVVAAYSMCSRMSAQIQSLQSSVLSLTASCTSARARASSKPSGPGRTWSGRELSCSYGTDASGRCR